MDEVQRLFSSLLKEKGLDCPKEKAEKFEIYFQELVKWNDKVNLTRITDRTQVYIKHFYDSLSLSFFIAFSSYTTLADIGSGAGFPAIPLKIMFPHLQVILVDSLKKRIEFLTHLSEMLDLSGVQFLHGRAEDYARLPRYRDQFDIVTARAVARLNALNELCLPFVRKGGLFAAMKGSALQDELEEAAFSLRELRSGVRETHSFQLPVEESGRHIVIIEKFGATPAAFPRKAGIPLKSPLSSGGGKLKR